jgi:glycosyltransferase involved in cell wall biosynthesis
MNIGFLTELFPPSIGGQEQRFAELAGQMTARGHQVTVICIGHADGLPLEETLPNEVRVIRRPTVPHYVKPYRGRLPRSPLGMVRYAMGVRRLTKTLDFDVLFLNQWPLFHVLALSRQNRARAVLDWCEVRNGSLFKALQAILPRMVAANTAVSEQVAQDIRGSAQRDVTVLPSGITTAVYRMHDPAVRRGLLYVGRIAAHKNLALLIDTFDEMCRRAYSGPLTIAGGGPALDSLRERVNASPYRSRIDLPGVVSDEQKYELLAGAKLLMITSQREGFPRVVAEAMASGLPVVTARFPENGTVSVVEDFQCGICTQPTADKLADGAQALLDDWDAWSSRAHHRAAGLESSSLTRQFEMLLSETARTASAPTALVATNGGATCVS